MPSTRAITAAILGLGAVFASPVVNSSGSSRSLPRQRDEWQNHASWTFEGDSLPDGLRASNEDLSSGLNSYRPENVVVRNGNLELLVNGGQASHPYIGGQVTTEVENILYASVRTVATFTETPGVCNGIFFYASDTQETDIEWLSDANSNQNLGERKVWLTNQDQNGDGQSTYKGVTAPGDITSAEHEYRIDWTEGSVKWFIDGELAWETTEDVPNVPGPWVFNNWSNGDQGWSAGPPAEDAIFKIRSIDMDYNTA